MRGARELLLTGCLLATAPAQATVLDGFVCQFVGCAVLLNSGGAELYIIVGARDQPSVLWVTSGTARPVLAVRSGSDQTWTAPAADEGTLLGIDADGDGLVDELAQDLDADGWLDANDALAPVALGPSTRVNVQDRFVRHSFWLASSDDVDIYGRSSITGSGTIGAAIALTDVRYASGVQESGTDGAFSFGAAADASGFIAVGGVNDLGDLAAGPVRAIRFNQPTRAAPAGTIAAQAVRLDHAYEFMDYDLGSGSGGVNPEVEFFIYNP
jgi:hypothetical protein